MKKRILSVILTALLLLTAIPMTVASANAIGDIDGDGEVKAGDARLALRASVGLEAFTDEQNAAADVDFDGAVKAADARLILRASVGLESLHKHAYTQESVTKAASCTEKGEKKLICECGDFITEEIPATGHKEVKDKAVAATCTKDGKTEGSHCSVCNEVLKAQTVVKAKGHTKVLDKTTVKAATCTEDGYSGDYKCSVCKTVLTKGKVVESKGTEHVMETVTVEAGCTQDGYSVSTCKNCDYFDESTYKTGEKAKGHSWSKLTTVDPTCTEQGYKTRTCSACQAIEKSDYTDPKGHNYSWKTTDKATCIKTGSRTGTCKTCGAKTTEAIAFTACTPEAEYVKGNETTLCKQVMKCSVCNTVISEREVHTMVADGSPSEATCTQHSTVDKKCRYCYHTETDVFVSEALGHKATLDTASTEKETCTKDGKYVYSGECERCHEILDNQVVTIKAKGHDEVGEQTCTTAVTCTRCDEIVAPALGHDYTEYSAAYGKNIDTFFCGRCGSGKSTADNLATFNSVANSIKTYAFYGKYSESTNLYFIDKTAVDTAYSRFDFGIYTAAIRDMYEDEMANNPDDYSPIRQGGIRTSLPLRNDYATVSELTAGDIDSIQVDKISGVKASEVLSQYATKYTVGSREYDLTNFKNVTVNKDVIRVVIDIKNEQYTVVSRLPANQKTALEKIYSFNIRDQAEEFKNDKGELVMNETEKGDGYEISMTMRLRDIYSDGTVTYYLDAETYEPIMAVYNADIRMEQSIDMSFRIGLFNLNGVMDPIITTNYTSAYLFPNYFAK